jgi:hypothetical protein
MSSILFSISFQSRVARFFLGTIYQNGKNIPKDCKLLNVHNTCQMNAIIPNIHKNVKNFHSKACHNIPKLVWKIPSGNHDGAHIYFKNVVFVFLCTNHFFVCFVPFFLCPCFSLFLFTSFYFPTLQDSLFPEIIFNWFLLISCRKWRCFKQSDHSFGPTLETETYFQNQIA